MKAPNFWKSSSIWQKFLLPLSWVYTLGYHLRRKLAIPYRAGVPVWCVGNITLGGAGKTPVTLALQAWLQQKGIKVHVVSRGYPSPVGSTPLHVDPHHHTAQQVGDEPLLFAQQGPTWVSSDKKQALQAAEQAGAELILVDDGMQNPTFHKDITLWIMGSLSDLGNHSIFPAGPLRESPKHAVSHSTALLSVEELTKVLSHLPEIKNLPCFQIQRHLELNLPKTTPIIAFCGLGQPEQFYQNLQDLGYTLKQTQTFPDHHTYTSNEEAQLLKTAQQQQARLVCTAKDAIKLSKEFLSQVDVVNLRVSLPKSLTDFLEQTNALKSHD